MTQRVFITGGASGLGRELALRYSRDGARVAIGDINATDLGRTRKELAPDALALTCDVTRETDLQAAAASLKQEWGGVDIVINNAGVATAGGIADEPLEQWEWVLNINLLGVVRGCKTFTPLFREQGHGQFINIASMAGLTHPPMMGSYNASKAGVVALSETLRIELRDDNIGVSVVCPSFFRTNLNRSLRSTLPGMDKTLDRLFAKSPISAADIADHIVQKAARNAFYILPHEAGRKAWLMKRCLPTRLYLDGLYKQTRRMKEPQ